MTLPTFAVVSAIYNVGRYLDDFFGSLDRQSFGPDRLHVVLVIDGATDDSLERCERWKAETELRVTIITKENGGQASARNRGLEAVDEDWVTFIDPDDFVSDGYFDEVAEQINAHPDAVMAVTHLKDFHEKDGEIRDSHPLRYRFKGGNQLVDVDRFPTYIHLSASSAFFKTELLNDNNIRFDEMLRPIFEDGHLIQCYLLAIEDRLVAFVETAAYYYRRRADSSSTLQSAGVDPGRYTTVLERGYLDALKRAQAGGEVPRWLQNTIIYEISWVLRAEEAMTGATAAVDGKTASRFNDLVVEIRRFIDDAALEEFRVIGRSLTQRLMFMHGYGDHDWCSGEVVVTQLSKERNLAQLRYFYTGLQPSETFYFRGKEVRPYAAKTRTIPYMRRRTLHERIVWLPANGTISVSLNGRPAALSLRYPEQKKYSLRPAEIEARYIGAQSSVGPKGRARRPMADRAIELAADSRPFSTLFKNAWVVMDSIDTANDNGEHLFRYLRNHRRDINAWFVLKKGSPDWKRLKAAGYKRLVDYGSLVWKALCLNAKFIISSHANPFVYSPFELSGGRKPGWRFVFLQHGIIKDDLSRWLNRRVVDLMVTSTPAEYNSICGNGSNYTLSPLEVRLTGLPRFDTLKKKSALARRAPRLITIMPTWRHYLTSDVSAASGYPDKLASISDSKFIRSWVEVLHSPDLKQLAEGRGLSINFMPHPNLLPLLERFNVPDYVSISTYHEDSVQDILVDSVAVVTDYSSVAFDAALINRPVVYYQFDHEDVFGGKHLTRSGYFSYDYHGLGPVVEDLDALVPELLALLDPSSGASELFDRRRKEFFAGMPEDSCGAVVSEVLNLSKPVKPKQAFDVPISTPDAPPIKYFN